jgi:hypothetical protein
MEMQKAAVVEVWKPVVSYEDLYEVSSLGNVRSIRFKRILRGAILQKGYRQVSLHRGSSKTFMVASLVITAFKGPKPLGREIDHKNRVRSDDRLSNLWWATKRENNLNKDRHYNSSSGGVTGVTFQIHYQKWMAQVSVGGKYRNLGRFNTIEEAALAVSTFNRSNNVQMA